MPCSEGRPERTAAARLFIKSPAPGVWRVIDISSDGPNNAGPPITLARDVLVASGVTINGLPLAVPDPNIGPWSNQQADPGYLDRYYEDCVIGGVGAFAISVHGTLAFAAALRRKLVLEIANAGQQKAVIVAADYRKVSAVDCTASRERRGK